MSRYLRNAIGFAGGLLTVLLVAGLAFGHESWLQPTAFFVDRAAPQIVRMTSGMGEHYPAPETAIEAGRVVKSGVLLDGATLPLKVGKAATKELELTWTPTKEGVAAAWVQLAPKTLVLEDSLIDVYFDEIGASPELRRQWTTPTRPKQWRESYAKYAKTYVRIGNREARRRAAADVGMALEIIPDGDPTTLRAGDSLVFHVRSDRERLPSFTVAVFREGGSKPVFVKTDRSGRGVLRLDRAGSMLLAAVHLVRVHEKDLEWRSKFTSMTFAVRAR